MPSFGSGNVAKAGTPVSVWDPIHRTANHAKCDEIEHEFSHAMETPKSIRIGKQSRY